MQGHIQVARKSKSGKNLSVQVSGDWYVSKNWEFENMVGQEITFEPAVQTFNDGGSITWINEYNATGQSTTPAGQAFDAAHAQAPPMGQPAPMPTSIGNPGTQAPQTDKELTITALALVKCLEGIKTPQQAFEAFNEMKALLSGTSAVPYDDDLPY